MQVFDLKPTDNHASFYGKAKVEKEEEGIYLRSYNTRVAMIDNAGNFNKLWKGYSATTMRHINSFRETYGMSRIGKSEWVAMPVEWRYAIV